MVRRKNREVSVFCRPGPRPGAPFAAKITPSFPYPFPFPNGGYRAAIDFVALADGIVEHLLEADPTSALTRLTKPREPGTGTGRQGHGTY
jgi:hypothetical protein